MNTKPAHAKLSPSGAHRWMTCPASVALESQFPNVDSVFAREGSAAHALAEYCLKNEVSVDTQIGNVFENYRDFPVSEEMAKNVQTYIDYVNSIPRDALYVEGRYDLGEWIPDSFGTADAVVIKDNTAYVIDLKFGRGVAVDAEHNHQAMLYGLGVLNNFDILYTIDKLVLVIVQPRLQSISEWEITTEDLLTWGEKTVKPAALATQKRDAPFCPTEKSCKFCRASGSCKALATYTMEIIATELDGFESELDIKEEDLLTNEELAILLPQLDTLTLWVSAVRANAQAKLESGESISGYKLVEATTRRKYIDDEHEIVKLLLNELELEEDEIFDQKLKSFTTIEKMVKKSCVDAESEQKAYEVLNTIITKPQGKPIIVPESDKRQPYLNLELADQFLGIDSEAA